MDLCNPYAAEELPIIANGSHTTSAASNGSPMFRMPGGSEPRGSTLGTSGPTAVAAAAASSQGASATGSSTATSSASSTCAVTCLAPTPKHDSGDETTALAGRGGSSDSATGVECGVAWREVAAELAPWGPPASPPIPSSASLPPDLLLLPFRLRKAVKEWLRRWDFLP